MSDIKQGETGQRFLVTLLQPTQNQVADRRNKVGIPLLCKNESVHKLWVYLWKTLFGETFLSA